MDRRSTLAAIFGKKKASKKASLLSPQNAGLDPYTGPWGVELAAHLLRRTIYGPTFAEINQAVQDGMESVVTQLLSDQVMPDPPVNFFFQDDPNVAVGETWIDAPYSQDTNYVGYRTASLRAWTFGLMVGHSMNIREKMTLFWHNHFVVERAVVNDPKYLYRYISILRENTLGNFRELVKLVTVDPSMLRYLNGNQNTRVAPNENYSRELLELFTIGKGPAAGPGDYTNYTEDDVVAMARVLTGWRDQGYRSIQQRPIQSVFVLNRHDQGSKQLSHRFNNVVINNANEDEYKNLIDIIFQQDEVARFICRKLYRWLVYYTIDDDIEQNVIEPMAQMLIANDYEVKPVIETLLKSEHFYSIYSLGPMIKNPLDFMVGTYNQFSTQAQIPTNFQVQYNVWNQFSRRQESMQMQYYSPPNVAGWKAYYQQPVFYQHWINSVTLPIRMEYTDTMVVNGVPFGQNRLKVDVLGFAAQIPNGMDPNALIDEFVKILFPQPITDKQKAYLKEILIPGLPDFEWTVEYGDYLANPDDEDLKNSVENKLRSLLKAMLNMPEYYLS